MTTTPETAWHQAASLAIVRKVEREVNARLSWNSPAMLFAVILHHGKGLEAFAISAFTEAALQGADTIAMLHALRGAGIDDVPEDPHSHLWGWLLVVETEEPELRLATVCSPQGGIVLVSRDRATDEVREARGENVSGPAIDALRLLTAATVRSAADYVSPN